MENRIISITAKRPTFIASLGIKVEAGITEKELDKKMVDKFEKEYQESAYYKTLKEKKKLNIQFKELTQEEIDDELEALKKQYSEKGKYSDLLGLNPTELAKAYEEEIGEKPGNRKTATILKSIIEHREEND